MDARERAATLAPLLAQMTEAEREQALRVALEAQRKESDHIKTGLIGGPSDGMLLESNRQMARELQSLRTRLEAAERERDAARAQVARILELEEGLERAAAALQDGCSNVFGGEDCIASNFDDEDACIQCSAARRARAALPTPTPAQPAPEGGETPEGGGQ